MPKVRFTRAGVVESELELEARDYRLGRASDNDIVLKDPDKTLSRHHAEIRFDGTQYVYLDLNSANGSWVGSEQVTRQVLDRGLVISLGDYDLSFGAAGKGEDTAPDADMTRVIPIPAFPGAAQNAPRRDTAVLQPHSSPPPLAAAAPAAAAARTPAPAKGWSPLRRVIIYGWIIVGGAFAVMLAALLRPDPPAPTGASPAAGAAEVTTSAPAATTTVESVAVTAPAVQPEQAAATPAAPGLAPAATTSAAASAPVVPAGTAAPAAPPRAATATPPSASGASATARATPARPRPARPEADAGAAEMPARPGESAAAARARREDARRKYDLGLQRLAAGDYGEARSLLSAVAAESPGYRDVAARLAEAESGLRQQAKEGFDAAARHEQAGEWTEAVRSYERLRPLAASVPGLDEALTRARTKMHEAGVEALTRARQYDSRGRIPEAIGWYQRAVAWLPPDHPGLEAARQRLAQLGGRP